MGFVVAEEEGVAGGETGDVPGGVEGGGVGVMQGGGGVGVGEKEVALDHGLTNLGECGDGKRTRGGLQDVRGRRWGV